MAINIPLKPGTRVMLTGDIVGVSLSEAYGTVVHSDTYDDYYGIRLDSPAIYHNADGLTEDLI